jgi:hypothetical protein
MMRLGVNVRFLEPKEKVVKHQRAKTEVEKLVDQAFGDPVKYKKVLDDVTKGLKNCGGPIVTSNKRFLKHFILHDEFRRVQNQFEAS